MFRMTEVVHLKPDRTLLDPDFDGYKLSLEGLPQYPRSLETDVDRVFTSDEQYSFLHANLFGTHNHLICDPWNPHSVHWIDKAWNVWRLAAVKGAVGEPTRVWEIPSHTQRISGHYNPAVCFIDEDKAVVSDGAGVLHIVNTGDRSTTSDWKVLWNGDVLGDSSSFSVFYGTFHDDVLDVLLYRVLNAAEVPEWKLVSQDSSSEFLSMIYWTTFANNQETGNWSLQRVRKLVGDGTVDYAAVQHDGASVMLGGKRGLHFIYDSEKTVELQEAPTENKKPPKYLWTQTDNEVNIWLICASDVTKEDIHVLLEEDRLSIKIEKQDFVLEGELGGRINLEASTWTRSGDKLVFVLSRPEGGTKWEEGIKGEPGEELVDPKLAEEVHRRLAHLTSSTFNPDPSLCEKGYNVGELEECDLSQDETTLYHWDGETHLLTCKVLLGNSQWLWTSSRRKDTVPEICVRHDVDGLVWCCSTEGKWSHVATHHALGYVQASKSNKKFALDASDHSYAALCDVSKHVYVYQQPSRISTDLRNRKSGHRVREISKQMVISLSPSESEVLGVHASDSYLFFLLSQSVIAVQVKEEK